MSLDSRGRFGAFLVLLAGALALLAAVLVPLWKPVLLALVLAGALAPWHEALTRRLRRRRLAAALLLVGLVVVVVIPISAIVIFAVRETIAGAQHISALVQLEGLRGLVELVPDRFQPQVERWLESQPDWARDLAMKAPAQGLAAFGAVRAALSATGKLLFEAAMMLVALFFLLLDGRHLAAWAVEVSPLGREDTRALLGELRHTGSAVLVSAGVTAGAQSIVALAGYWLAGVPHPFFFAALTFFAAFIPSVGTTVVGLPVAIYLVLAGRWGAGLFLAAWALLLTGTIDNLLKPWLAHGAARLHGALLFFAMVGGILAFGPVGLLFGPLALSLLLALARLGRSAPGG